jgi:hypothetical protein
MRKTKVRVFARLGMPIGRESKTITFTNYANELKDASVSLFGRTCGRVDFFFPQWVSRMTADDAEKLANALLEAAREAREAEGKNEVTAS